MAIEKQPKGNVPIDVNRLTENILKKVSHIVSLDADIPRKELIELRDLYLQLQQVDKTTLVNVSPDTIDKLYKSVNAINPVDEKSEKNKFDLNEMSEGQPKGIEQVAQEKVSEGNRKALQTVFDYSIEQSIKTLNAIIDVDTESRKTQVATNHPEKIDKALAVIVNDVLSHTVKNWIGIENPEEESIKTQEEISGTGPREIKEEVLADRRESTEARLAGEGVTKPEKGALPVGSFPEFIFKSQEGIDYTSEKEEKSLQDVPPNVEHEEKIAVEQQSSVEHEEKIAEPTPEDATREEKQIEELTNASTGEEKEVTDVSPEVYEVEKARRWETEEDVDDTTIVPVEKEGLDISGDNLSDTSRDILGNQGLKGEKDRDSIPDADDPVPFLSKKYRQVGWMEGLTSFFNAKVLNQGDPRQINYQVPQNKEMTNMITGITAQANPFGLGLNIPTGGVGRFLAGAATIFPPFSGTTTAEIAKAINKIQRKINEAINAFELDVNWQIVDLYKLRGQATRTIDGGAKEARMYQLYTRQDGPGGSLERVDLDEFLAFFTTRRTEEEYRKLKEGDFGNDTEGNVRMLFESSARPSEAAEYSQGRSKTKTRSGDPFEMAIGNREPLEKAEAQKIPEHKFYNRLEYLLEEAGSRRCPGFLKVFLMRAPIWPQPETNSIRYIPFQFDPEVSGDGKRANYSALTTLARSQSAFAYRNSEARKISLTLPYLVVDMSDEMNRTLGPELKYKDETLKKKSQSVKGLEGWDEDFIYNYVVRMYQQLALPNFPEQTNFRLAPPLVQVWYGGLDVQEGTSSFKVSSIRGGAMKTGGEIDDKTNTTYNDIPPVFRSNWYSSSSDVGQYTMRSIFIVDGVSFEYKHGFVNAHTKNRIAVDVKLDLTEVGPGVTRNQIVTWREDIPLVRNGRGNNGGTR